MDINAMCAMEIETREAYSGLPKWMRKHGYLYHFSTALKKSPAVTDVPANEGL